MQCSSSEPQTLHNVMPSMQDMQFFFLMGIEVTMETYYCTDTKQLKFHTVCISQISVFEVVLKYQSQTSYMTNMSFGHTFISLFMGC